MRFYKAIIGDSRDMHEVGDRTVQFVITSPPYWNLVEFSPDNPIKGDLSLVKSKKRFFEEVRMVWEEVYRVLVPGGIFVLETEDYPVGSRVYGYPRVIFLQGDFVKSVESTGLYLISQWFWKKFQSGSALRKFQYTMYDNLHQSTPRAVSNVAYCFAFMKRTKAGRDSKLDFTRKDWVVWSDSLWYIENPAGELEWGRATFAVELIKRFIRIYTNKGDTVLDPFVGTGTTLRAAYLLKRNGIGYEVDVGMLDTIKKKACFGQQPLDEEIEWRIIKR